MFCKKLIVIASKSQTRFLTSQQISKHTKKLKAWEKGIESIGVCKSHRLVELENYVSIYFLLNLLSKN